ncbi:polyhomeotic-like protein 2 isoform X3 [Patiria miniata]|uniref:Polyhomeotic-like protein 2 n=1 Tax=Patiria miniata TaxID=46514 RepID=A0A914AF39_PATMI|nr:polyhomeotic-like protein 2 isoform X3 [Patiria miniata]
MSGQQSSPRPQASAMATTPPNSVTMPPANPPLLVEQPKHPMTTPSPSSSSVTILPPAVPPPAHQRLTLPPPSSSNTSGGHSPTAGLGPPVLSPSHHQHPALYPSGSSPVSAPPIPMTVTSPIGKHGGSLGALTASVNALQRPTSTSGHYLVQHSPKSPPSTALVSGIPSGIRLLRQPSLKSPSGARSDQAVIITTQTPIFNRSHHLPTTATVISPSGTTTTVSTLVRVTPSMQQAIHHPQQPRLIIQPRMMGNLGLITTADGPLIRGVTPTCSMVNPTVINPYNVSQSKLHSALTGFGDGHPPRIHLPPSPHGPLSLVAQVQPQGKSTFALHPQKSIATSNLSLHPQMRTIAPARSPTSHVPLQPKRPPPYSSGPSTPLSQHPLSPGASDAIKHTSSKVKPPTSAPKSGPQVKPIKPVQQQAQRSGVKVVKPVQREKKSQPAPVPVPPLVIPTAPVRPDVSSTVQPQQSHPPSSQPEIVSPQRRAEVVGVTEGVARVERQVPKAVVKPQVLTHVIDGFIIEESKEPFSSWKQTGGASLPATRISPSSLWSDDYPQLDASLQRSRNVQDGQLDGSQPQKRSATSECLEDSDHTPLRCEFCGKRDRPHKFKRSKRFCSLACSKRYNVGCSKRLGLFAPQRENSERLKHKLKLQTKAKPLKGSRGKHGRLSFNVDRPWTNRVYSQDPPPGTSGSAPLPQSSNPTSANTMGQDRDSNSSAGPSEGSSSMESSLTLSPAPNSDDADDTTPVSDDAFDDPSGLGDDPAKWSVQDVYDFIRDLPGCSDYADEFLRQEIDGQALMLLKEDHLMTAMNMKLGPALKIISRIYSLKEKL